MLTKNLFEVGQRSFDPDIKSVVFISYRRKICDMQIALKCAEILENNIREYRWTTLLVR